MMYGKSLEFMETRKLWETLRDDFTGMAKRFFEGDGSLTEKLKLYGRFKDAMQFHRVPR